MSVDSIFSAVKTDEEVPPGKVVPVREGGEAEPQGPSAEPICHRNLHSMLSHVALFQPRCVQRVQASR